jgi:hypothetical protein
MTSDAEAIAPPFRKIFARFIELSTYRADFGVFKRYREEAIVV